MLTPTIFHPWNQLLQLENRTKSGEITGPKKRTYDKGGNRNALVGDHQSGSALEFSGEAISPVPNGLYFKDDIWSTCDYPAHDPARNTDHIRSAGGLKIGAFGSSYLRLSLAYNFGLWIGAKNERFNGVRRQAGAGLLIGAEVVKTLGASRQVAGGLLIGAEVVKTFQDYRLVEGGLLIGAGGYWNIFSP